MENIITRHRNATILMAVLFVQLLGLAYQVKRTTDRGSTRLVRIWAVTMITPLEKAVVHSVSGVADTWHNYLYLRDVRRQNEQLRDEIQRLRLEQVRLAQDAGQARRLQALLGFKEQFISDTMAAQVISTTGSEFSRGIYIDKGSRDGLKPDMPVITAEGVVGKVYRVYPTSSLVLEINDPSSGAGVILDKSRLQGILKGSPNGETFVANIMSDEQVEAGEHVLTSGGDRVYPKGLAVGTVTKAASGGTFLNILVKPSARLDRLEEVLVITKIVEKSPDVNAASGPVRAIDILAERLPSVPPPKPPEDKNGAGAKASPAAATPAGDHGATLPATTPKPQGSATVPAATPKQPSKAAVPAVTTQQPMGPAVTPRQPGNAGLPAATPKGGSVAGQTKSQPSANKPAANKSEETKPKAQLPPESNH